MNPAGASGAAQAAATAKEKKVQQLIATCMTGQGFTYQPFVPPSGPPALTGDVASGSREFAVKYGYGVSTIDYSATGTTESTDVDPNQAAVDAMPPAQKDAYNKALYGSGAGATSSTSLDRSCTDQARSQVSGQASSDPQPQFQSLFDAMTQLYADVDNVPAVGTALHGWADCMADAGHPGYTKAWSANNEVIQKWGDLNGGPQSSGGAVVPTNGTAPAAPAANKVADFKTYEVGLAVTDFDCKQTSSYAEVVEQTRVDAEKKFVEDHRAELEQYRDVVNGGG